MNANELTALIGECLRETDDHEFFLKLESVLRQQQAEIEALKQVLQSIANEHVELSHDKIKWQCDDHIRWAKEALK